MKLPAGKLPNRMLGKFLASLPFSDPAVVVAGGIGEDASVLDTGGPELLVAKTDPITFATRGAGRYLLAVNGNDLASMGAEPRWLLVTVLLPEGVTEQRAADILGDLRDACREADIALVGGHTEITMGLDRPILVGCLLGTVPRSRVLRTAGARAGDVLLLAGGIAIEGTAILAREHGPALVAAGVDPAVVARAAAWTKQPGISVLPAARILRDIPSIHALHDPTEGGLATAVAELCQASGVGVRLDAAAIPVLPECRLICEALGLEPLGLLASGALLASLGAADAPAALARLHEAGIEAAGIGELLAPDDPHCTPLPEFPRDELARYLEATSSR